jgi:hypothetical protein
LHFFLHPYSPFFLIGYSILKMETISSLETLVSFHQPKHNLEESNLHFHYSENLIAHISRHVSLYFDIFRFLILISYFSMVHLITIRPCTGVQYALCVQNLGFKCYIQFSSPLRATQPVNPTRFFVLVVCVEVSELWNSHYSLMYPYYCPFPAVAIHFFLILSV